MEQLMPQVKASVQCFVDNSLRNEGDVFEYNGPPSRHLELLDGKSSPMDVESDSQKMKLRPVRRKSSTTE